MYEVGDFVMLGSDKYEGKVYGIIINIDRERDSCTVFWLDEYGESAEALSSNCLFKLSKAETNEIPSR
jgi:hypothetical protein